MDAIRSLFTRSKDHEHLIQTIQGIQQSTAERASTEEEMKTIIDGFVGYIRALEHDVQVQVEKAMREEKNRADEELESRLDAAGKDLKAAEEDLESYRTKSELSFAQAMDDKKKNEQLRSEIESYLKQVQGNEKRIAELESEIEADNSFSKQMKDRADSSLKRMKSDKKRIVELKSQIHFQDIVKSVTDAEYKALRDQGDSVLKKRMDIDGKRIAELESRVDAQELQSRLDAQELQSRVDTQNSTKSAMDAEIKALEDQVDSHSKKIKSDEKRIVELQWRVDSQHKEIEALQDRVDLDMRISKIHRQGIERLSQRRSHFCTKTTDDKQIQLMESHIKELHGELDLYSDQCIHNTKRILELKSQLAFHNLIPDDLYKSCKEAEEIVKTNAEQRRTIEEQERTIEEQDRTIEEQQRTIEEEQRTIGRYKDCQRWGEPHAEGTISFLSGDSLATWVCVPRASLGWLAQSRQRYVYLGAACKQVFFTCGTFFS